MGDYRFDEIHEDMDVLDAQGEKVGSVETVYTPSDASGDELADSRRPTLGGLTLPRPGHVGVRSGLFGMGKYRYIPFGLIRQVRDGALRLDVSRQQLETMDLDAMPAASSTANTDLLAPHDRQAAE